jgi:UDP-N-acetylglucosamine:LPS N-acetylglucosamine transferase
MTPARKNVDVIFFDAASGHRSAARAVERALTAARPTWRVRCVNLLDLLAGNRWFTAVVRCGIDRFNRELTREQVIDLRGKVNLSLLLHDLLTPAGVRDISRFWEREPPDAVVSVTPMYNPALYRAARLVNPHVHCVTVPVDCEEYKARYWFTPRVEQHYLLGTERLRRQARALPIPARFLHPISGMIVDPEVYAPGPGDRDRTLARLGLDPALPTGLVHFGGQGSVVLARVARHLARAGLRLNVIFLCGHDAAVRKAVSRLATPYPKVVLGYTPETPIAYQRLADVIIGKPGVMTINEALVLGKPLVMVKARSLGPVQEGNEVWAVGRDVAILAERAQDVPAALRRVLASPRYRAAAARHHHRGVFDAAVALVRILETPAAREAAVG